MTVYIDRIDTLSLREEGGVLVSVTRKALVTGLVTSDWEAMIEAMNKAGVPSRYSYLDASKYPHLVLTQRNTRIVDVDKAEVELVYEKNAGPTQDLGDQSYPGTPIYSTRMAATLSASVQQLTTNKDANGDLITVSHTYGMDDMDYPGETFTQTGEITVYIPQKTVTIEGYRTTSSPETIAARLLGKVNNGTWFGDPSRHWMCTDVSSDKVGHNVYAMSFQYQYNPDSWDPVAVFIDDRTGQPPPGIVAGVGYKTIRYPDMVDFESEMGFYVEGS